MNISKYFESSYFSFSFYASYADWSPLFYLNYCEIGVVIRSSGIVSETLLNTLHVYFFDIVEGEFKQRLYSI